MYRSYLSQKTKEIVLLPLPFPILFQTIKNKYFSYLDAATVMFHRSLFKDSNNYFLQETQESVTMTEKFLSGESEDRPDIFRVNIVLVFLGEMFCLFWKKKAMKGIPFIFYSKKNKHFTLCLAFLYLNIWSEQAT